MSSSSSSAASSSNRVGEIFTFAGQAFTKLGELTMHLHSTEANEANHSGQKWDEEDIEMFKMTIKKFGEDLNKLSDTIKNKTVTQLKGGLKRKAFDNKGISLTSSTNSKKTAKINQSLISSSTQESKNITKSAQSNSLNTFSSETTTEEADKE